MLIKMPVKKAVDNSKVVESAKGVIKGQLFVAQVNTLETKKKERVVRQPKIIDDSLEVSRRIKELFAKYEHRYKLVTTEEELIEYMSTRPELGFDTETNGKDSVWIDSLVGFSIGNEQDCIYVPLFHEVGENYKGDYSRLGEILNRGGIRYWGMNSKFDRSEMSIWAGFDIKMKWDAEIGARLLDNRESAALKPQYQMHIDPTEEFYDYSSLFKQKFSKYDPKVVGIYGGVDAIKHIVIGKYQEKRMKEEFPRIYKLMKNIELPLVDVVLDMEMKGIAIDKPYYEQFKQELESEMNIKLDELQKDYPNFNPNSPKQVAEVLFDRLRLPDPSRARKTGEEFLAKINHPVPKAILALRGLKKALSTYVLPIPQLAVKDKDGLHIVHTTYHTIGADTGRFSSSNPNMQNQPKDNRFRRGFIARPGCKLVSCDFSQQEQAVLAGASRDPKMLEGAEAGKDYYALFASIIWDLPYERCTKKGDRKDLRNLCKSLVLGITYGMGADSLAESLNASSKDHVFTVEEAKGIMDKFLINFPQVSAFKEWCHEFATENGYMEDMLGRRRYFKYLGRPPFECPDNKELEKTLNSLKYYNQIRACLDEAKSCGFTVVDNRWRQGDEMRQTVNHVCQGTAATQTKICMISLFNDETFRNKYKGQILLQVHDELIAEFPEELAEEGGKYMAKVMSDVGSAVIGTKIWCSPQIMAFWEKD